MVTSQSKENNPVERKGLSDRIQGSLLAGAIGDAYGGRFENMDVPAREEKWRISDDTQLTLATCESILEAQKVSPEAVANSFHRWNRINRITGMGASTLQALVGLSGKGHWSQVGAKGERSAGNGSAMRMAPLAFMLDPHREEDRKIIRDVARITHHHEEAYVGALAVVYAIRFIQNDNHNFIQQVVRRLPDSQVRDRIQEISNEPGLSISQIGKKYGSSGFVVDSVPLALFAAQEATHKGLKAVMKEIVVVGGDTDTNCSITGQIAGTYLGTQGLPEDWRERLKQVDWFESEYRPLIKEFADFVEGKAKGQPLF